jgi:Peptidase S46
MTKSAYFLSLLFLARAGFADEGMWRLDRLPKDVIAERYGVSVSDSQIAAIRASAVRILAGGSGGTGTFASPNGLILTNHHVALDCVRTSTLAGDSDNYLANGFTAPAIAEELSCKRFLVQVEREAKDVTSLLDAAVTKDMGAAQIQQARSRARNDLERSCQTEKGDDFVCDVVDYNSGALSLLIVYEQFKDIRLVYAPEVNMGYFGGDEMNFRFPRYVSDVSILRAYVAPDGAHREYAPDNVPVKPDHYLKVSLDGVKEGDFAFIAGFPGNTNRYRMSFSADYNVSRGIPNIIRDLDASLSLLRKYAAMKPAYDVLLKSRIFGLANSLKYESDVLAALKANGVVAERKKREEEFTRFLDSSPAAKAEYGGVLDAQARVYREDVQAFDDVDSAIGWLQQSTILGYASGLYELALARAKSSDADREPQFQERNWPQVRQGLLDDDPIIAELDEDFLARGFELALALAESERIPAVESLAKKVGRDPQKLAHAVVEGSKVPSLEARKSWIDASADALTESGDSAFSFAQALEPTLAAARTRTRVLNEKLFINRARFARGMAAWKKERLYYDANFTLRATFGRVQGYTDSMGKEIPFTTRFAGLFELAKERGNEGDYALPKAMSRWRASVGDDVFREKYAQLPVDFVTTNDITGGNSGSSILDRYFHIVALVFDGNEASMVSDWSYNETTGRAIGTDLRFALFVARDVHGAGWIVDELTK